MLAGTLQAAMSHRGRPCYDSSLLRDQPYLANLSCKTRALHPLSKRRRYVSGAIA